MSIEAMKQALEALETCMYPQQKQIQAITSLRQAIEQAEKQEPVAWITHESKWRLTGGGNAGGTVPVHAKQSNTAKYPLYTTPQPQRKWVGLTDDERDDIWNQYCDEMGEASINDALDIVQAIEKSLKEKNT
jgi:hypothetical protein